MTGDSRRTGAESYRTAVARRTLLKGVAVAGGAGMAGVGAAQQDGPVAIRLDGDTAGWMVPEDAGEPVGEGPNPTLTLESGRDYEVTWENVDGVPHNFAVLDGDGETLLSSEIIDEQGATQTVGFTATDEMAEYLCEVHPSSMRGAIELGGGAGTPDGDAAEPFFQPGTEVGVQVVAEGMTAPTDFASHPELEGYLVTDQTGELWMVDPDEGLLEEPLVDLADRMVELGTYAGSYGDPESNYDERGLLGVDLHPDFPEDRRLFLHYSRPPNEETPEGWSHVEVVSAFEAGDGASVDPDSEEVLLSVQKPQYNHDAGPMAFGPDGYLYVPMGDGGGANDEMYGHVDDWYDGNAGGNGQDVEANLLGDVLRIDVDGGEGDRPYAVPDDNPFAGDDSPGRDEIYAYGFRNPFGISFDDEGNLFVADAGQNLFEEANVVENGGNYGWNVKEGTHCFSTDDPADPEAITDCPDAEPDEAPYDGSDLQDPIVEYPHTYQGESVGIVVVGGHRYQDDAIDGLAGKYVFGDWTKDPSRNEPLGRILAATPPEGFDGDGVNDGEDAEDDDEVEETGDSGDDVVPRDELWEMEELVVRGGAEGTLNQFVRMFGRNETGEVFVLANQLGRLLLAPDSETGYLFKLVPPEEGEDLPTVPDPLPGQEESPGDEDGDGAATNETAGNETGGNETGGNETGGNETGGPGGD